MMLALLLARAGVDVTIMEKHADFLRDFRGDTVHASTLRLLDELGLGSRFAQIPHRLIDTIQMQMEGQPVDLDLSHLPGTHQHIALVPQWDFLELLASAASSEPTFRLLRSTEVTGVIRGTGPERGRIIGVSYRDQNGEAKQMRAELTVACDGRSSTVRSAMGLVPQAFGAPMDVWWFRLPRQPDDPPGLAGTFSAGHGCIMIDRGDYYQIAYIIPKGTDADMRAQGIEALHRQLVGLVPWLAGRVDSLSSFDDVKLLDVQLNRLHRWYTDGALCIGDAAHAMSPVGGVGINLAIQDAVAAANRLAGPLLAGEIGTDVLADVQRRRTFPTRATQRVQLLIQSKILSAVLGARELSGPPLPMRLVNRWPRLQRIPARIVGLGFRPEHVATPDVGAAALA
jgi:2-polyprenyl-6-methoxyphenol hydroxylase-like FAD-dependent oxidoreductase